MNLAKSTVHNLRGKRPVLVRDRIYPNGDALRGRFDFRPLTEDQKRKFTGPAQVGEDKIVKPFGVRKATPT